MFPSCQHSIAQTEKTSWTKTEIKENAWPLDSASSEYGPGRFDCLSRWYKFSPQQDCIARRTAARHQAPSMTPSWTLLGAQGNCFHQISLFGGHIIKVCWPVLAQTSNQGCRSPLAVYRESVDYTGYQISKLSVWLFEQRAEACFMGSLGRWVFVKSSFCGNLIQSAIAFSMAFSNQTIILNEIILSCVCWPFSVT